MHFNLIWQRRGNVLSLKKILACCQEKCLSGGRIYPGWTDMTGEGAVIVHPFLDTGTGSPKELQYLDFFFVCVSVCNFPPSGMHVSPSDIFLWAVEQFSLRSTGTAQSLWPLQTCSSSFWTSLYTPVRQTCSPCATASLIRCRWAGCAETSCREGCPQSPSESCCY